MKINLTSLIACGILICFANFANASFIINDSYQVESFDISESFESFYGYGEINSGSSNTGFEENDTTVMFLAKWLGEFALFVIFDDLVSPDPFAVVDVTLTDNSATLGSLLLVDDGVDQGTFTGNVYNASHGFSNGRTDGFVYSLGNGVGTDINLLTDVVRGTHDGAIFLSNEDSGITQIILSNSTDIISNPLKVSAPGAAWLMTISIFSMLFRFIRKD